MFQYTMDEEHNLLLWKQAVTIDLNFMMEWAIEIAKLEKTRPPFNRFADLSDLLGISIQTSGLKQVAQQRELYSGTQVKFAMLARNPVSFGVSRMYQSIREGKGVDIEVFANVESCANWLDVPISILELDASV